MSAGECVYVWAGKEWVGRRGNLHKTKQKTHNLAHMAHVRVSVCVLCVHAV